ncbi:hypothetical protein CRUP_003220, partial [Coryphaenoides rupestris]
MSFIHQAKLATVVGAEKRTGFGGPAVSSLYQEETISKLLGAGRQRQQYGRLGLETPELGVTGVGIGLESQCWEEDKNIFDYCRENNIEHVSTAISSQKLDVNAKDEE